MEGHQVTLHQPYLILNQAEQAGSNFNIFFVVLCFRGSWSHWSCSLEVTEHGHSERNAGSFCRALQGTEHFQPRRTALGSPWSSHHLWQALCYKGVSHCVTALWLGKSLGRANGTLGCFPWKSSRIWPLCFPAPQLMYSPWAMHLNRSLFPELFLLFSRGHRQWCVSKPLWGSRLSFLGQGCCEGSPGCHASCRPSARCLGTVDLGPLEPQPFCPCIWPICSIGKGHVSRVSVRSGSWSPLYATPRDPSCFFFLSSIMMGQEVRPNQQGQVEVWLLVSTGCCSLQLLEGPAFYPNSGPSWDSWHK